MSSINEIVKNYDPEKLKKAFEKRNQRQIDQDNRIENHNGEVVVSEPVTPYLLEFEGAKLPFWTSYKKRLGFTPSLTSNNTEVLQGIIRWMIKDSKGEYDIQKGLFIYGAYGTGKTELIHAMHLFSLKCNHAKPSFENVRKLPGIQSYKFMLRKANEQRSIKGLYKTEGPSIIDDIGFKNETQLKIFGNDTNVISEIIESRYRAWKSNRNDYSIFTSNLEVEDIDRDHGEGISSRLIEMCNIIWWDGKNFRLV